MRRVQVVTIILLILIVVVLAATLLAVGYNNLIDYIKKLLGVSQYANVYNLYGYQYVSGVASLGPVLETYTNIESPLICSNYAAVVEGCVGANYNAQTQSCSLVSSLMPLNKSSETQLLTLSANKMTNNVSTWKATQGTAQKGVLFTDTSLNYIPYAAALCANIPECTGYALNFTGNDNYPAGSLLTDSTTASIRTTDVMSTLYTGTRTDGVTYNNNANGPFYRWATRFNGNADMTIASTTLTSCASTARSLIGALGASWNGGMCSIYKSVQPVVSSSQDTIIVWNASPNYLSYSNQYTTMTQTDYPTAQIVVTGLENSKRYTLNDAMMAVIVSAGNCNAIVQNTSNNNFVFKKITNSDQPSISSTTTTYLVPTNFV